MVQQEDSIARVTARTASSSPAAAAAAEATWHAVAAAAAAAAAAARHSKAAGAAEGSMVHQLLRTWLTNFETLPVSVASNNSGPEKGVITKAVFSSRDSLESQKSLESLENGRSLLYFPQSGVL